MESDLCMESDSFMANDSYMENDSCMEKDLFMGNRLFGFSNFKAIIIKGTHKYTLLKFVGQENSDR